MDRMRKAQRICAKLQMRAIDHQWSEKECRLWDTMIDIILTERKKESKQKAAPKAPEIIKKYSHPTPVQKFINDQNCKVAE